MANERVISFDLKADFAFFKKPDFNDGLQLSYNMLHKPALLGVLGAIIGLEGYKQKGELPLYYRLLKELPIGIEPIEGYHERGNFQKTDVKYTNGVGYANADGNLLVEETMLIKPAYRCYLQLNVTNETNANIYNHLLKAECEYVPYLGKNEFHAWIENIQEWEIQPLDTNASFTVDSLFVKEGIVRGMKAEAELEFAFDEVDEMGSFSYFERLPIGFNEMLFQYQLNDFAFTDWKLKRQSKISSLYQLSNSNSTKIIQFF